MRFERGDFGSYILVGDSGYRNTAYMATPFLNWQNRIENLYNESQIRTRNVVERSYGIIKRRFPILANTIQVNINTAQIIIVACAVLHNVAIDSNDVVPEDDNIIVHQPDVDADEHNVRANDNRNYENVRNELVANHFTTLLLGEEMQ